MKIKSEKKERNYENTLNYNKALKQYFSFQINRNIYYCKYFIKKTTTTTKTQYFTTTKNEKIKITKSTHTHTKMKRKKK